MRSTPSWVHELMPTKHEGVAKLHFDHVERKGTWTVRYEFEDSFVVPPDLPKAFRQKTKSSSFPAKNGKRSEWAVLRVVVVWAWHDLIGKTQRQCPNQGRYQQRWPISKAIARPLATPVLRRPRNRTLEKLNQHVASAFLSSLLASTSSCAWLCGIDVGLFSAF